MPQKGKELKIKHNLDIKKIINVNVIVLNGNKNSIIIRNQVDLLSQKVLYNWYVDQDNFILIRPNNVRNFIYFFILFIIF
jgi:hypothetical protein